MGRRKGGKKRWWRVISILCRGIGGCWYVARSNSGDGGAPFSIFFLSTFIQPVHPNWSQICHMLLGGKWRTFFLWLFGVVVAEWESGGYWEHGLWVVHITEKKCPCEMGLQQYASQPSINSLGSIFLVVGAHMYLVLGNADVNHLTRTHMSQHSNRNLVFSLHFFFSESI